MRARSATSRFQGQSVEDNDLRSRTCLEGKRGAELDNLLLRHVSRLKQLF